MANSGYSGVTYGGSFAIPNGSTFVTVTGANFPTVPTAITVNVIKSSGLGDNFSATVRNDSITTDGFIADLSGVINDTTYRLSYIAIVGYTAVVLPSSDVSVYTNQDFYSGSFSSIVDIVSLLNIGDGKMDKVNRQMVNRYQEMVDRAIDDILNEVYAVPLRQTNKMMPDGVVRKVFPGEVTRAARYWTAGLLMMNEFQQLATNVTEQVNSYVKEATDSLYEMKRPTHFLYGQRRKSTISKTFPPSLQAASTPQVLR